MMETAQAVYERLSADGYTPSLVNVRFVKPMDRELLRTLAETHRLFLVLEDNEEAGGYGEAVSAFFNEEALAARVLSGAIKDRFVEQGPVGTLRDTLGLSADSLAEQTETAWRSMKQ